MLNKKIPITICLSLLTIALGNVSHVSAEETATDCSLDFSLAAKEAQVDTFCPFPNEKNESEQYEKFISTEKMAFDAFIEQLFQNKTPNSGLVGIAMNKYQETRKKILDKQGPVMDALIQTNCSQIQVFEAYGNCKSIADQKLLEMYTPLKNHVISTAHVKRTTALMEKYQHLNGKLRDLNQSMTETFGYYLTFSNKLNNYVPVCE